VCTTSSTVEPSATLVREHARRQQREVEIESRLVDGAFKAITSGDREGHDRLVCQAAAELAGRNDVVILAQASMAHLAKKLDEELRAAVLASPDLCMEALVQRFSES
jgi:hypothetical protein